MLNVVFRSPGSVRKDLSFLISIFGGIAVNQYGGRTFPLSGERFEAAITIGIRVADQHDLAFDVDSILAQQFVVIGIAAMGVNNRRGDLAGG